jgi:Cu-Zn family superoxide dismutase
MRNVRRMRAVGWVLAVVAIAGACAERRTLVTAAERRLEAWAELKNAQGDSVGSGVFREEGGRVRLVVQAKGLTPGRHGVHVHSVGLCEAPTFQSAGDHFNPLGKKHGLENPEGPHAGDLPDLEADEGGQVQYVAVTDRLTLSAGPTSVFDPDGSALVIHAKVDDQRTDPSGNSGDRVLCGQIVSSPVTAAVWATDPTPARR